jgi:hydroxyethylthiazole kinase-like uncharacterized protein yjeF
MASAREPEGWGALESREFVRVPGANDDKYSHGVVGFVTGSERYPGAAVLGVEAAGRTGIGMIRYFGPAEPTRLVLARRPEVVTAAGRVDAYVVGSGIDAQELALPLEVARSAAIDEVLTSGVPVILDAGCLDRVARVAGPCVITPHRKELHRLLTEVGQTVSLEQIDADPAAWAQAAAELLGVTVLLKGVVTHVCSPMAHSGERFHATVFATTTWMATAGTGDVLAGILGSLLATHANDIAADASIVGRLAATAAFVHAQAGAAASEGGPLLALDVAEAIPTVIAGLV